MFLFVFYVYLPYLAGLNLKECESLGINITNHEYPEKLHCRAAARGAFVSG